MSVAYVWTVHVACVAVAALTGLAALLFFIAAYPSASGAGLVCGGFIFAAIGGAAWYTAADSMWQVAYRHGLARRPGRHAVDDDGIELVEDYARRGSRL